MEKEEVIRVLTRLVRDLGDQYSELKHLTHSLDVWHKSKALRKKLSNLALQKGFGPLKEWVPIIVNHFWLCCKNCNTDLAKLKVY